jgi:hypothetical protein
MAFVGLGLAFLLLGGAVAASPLAVPSLILGGLAFLIAVVAGLRERKDKYDLVTLKRVHEREEAASIELEEPSQYDSVHCIHCGTVYNNRMPACPNCGQR